MALGLTFTDRLLRYALLPTMPTSLGGQLFVNVAARRSSASLIHCSSSLPLRIMPCFYSLLRNAGSWLGACPCDLRAANLTPYASSFAFDGYDPVRVWGINDLLAQPAGSEAGFFTRHIYVLFEDIANLFAENGIRLMLDGFTWDTQMVRPFRKNQMNYSGRLGVV